MARDARIFDHQVVVESAPDVDDGSREGILSSAIHYQDRICRRRIPFGGGFEARSVRHHLLRLLYRRLIECGDDAKTAITDFLAILDHVDGGRRHQPRAGLIRHLPYRIPEHRERKVLHP